MAASVDSLSALLAKAHLDDHEEVLKAANSALAKSKSDLDAQHVRVIALLKLDRFDDALRQLNQTGDKLKQRAAFEYAYALYKTGKLAEAESVADSAVSTARGPSRGAQHVLAQATYRAENFERAVTVYEQLAARVQDADADYEHNDLRINSAAVDAQLEWQGKGQLAKKKKPVREDMEAFETAYNAACGSIARGELGQGEVLLKRARDLCNASEDMTEEEKRAEIMPILVQQLYVLSRQGRAEEAEKLSQELSIPDIPDMSTRHIAEVNEMAASTESSNPYLSTRRVRFNSNLPKTDQPFGFQSAILNHNNYVMEMTSHKHKGVATSTLTKLRNDPHASVSPATNSLSVLNAAAHTKGQVGKVGLREILPLVNKRPDDVGLILTAVQLYLLENNHSAAITLLESFLMRLENSATPSDHDVRFAPGLVGTLTALYAKEGRRSSIRAEFAKAAEHWRRKTDATPPAGLLKAAGAALLESSKPVDLELAGEIFSDLLQRDEGDRAAAAGLVAAYATTHPEKVTPAQTDALTPLARLIGDVDAAELEAAGVAVAPHVQQQTGAKRAAPKEQPAKPKKVRQSRLPKDMDPSKKIDPERWLPMKDRSYYKPKGRKGKARQAGLTQGGVVEDEGAKKQAAGQVVGASGGGGKNKKKKGKK
ncbi:uncharacterized protein K452DRAFT_246351 [Aplosporella prunicola CBS 121167]|uniref:Signal recognition particle subunit SRP72 n=1 Tax=Aplosporella prunicola CBS 121167 TaxID=1176127 RepID=A0A6A6BLH1_9PEZI|nr:uncharacterized protein K452DRAFT_246351 [Aplosporella prunicola CBS 121167]KAF2144145.1 hypothetical protein K452DRAFT_246351 [Aplosporella prunicola CBS 121167]